DVLSPSHVARAVRDLPGCRIINGYGPTENTTFTCCYALPANWPGDGPVPIGKPINNTTVYVLDRYGAPAPIGVPGELCVGGDGLARGYVNQPALTAEKFVPDPFGANGGRLYRTGDIVCWRPDGNLEFFGRKDQQVKIRGFRVEPGEIEAVLAGHPSIREAAVIARESRSGERELVAYVAFNADKYTAGEAGLRRFLESQLPPHLVPARFVPLDRLPLTANGKVNRRALPAPTVEPSAALTPPRHPTEETLLRIWRDVLGRDGFGVHENFF